MSNKLNCKGYVSCTWRDLEIVEDLMFVANVRLIEINVDGLDGGELLHYLRFKTVPLLA